MRLHQVLTGAANVLDNSVAIGHGAVSGNPFTVYGSGYEVVILDSHFNRVQIVSSHDATKSSIVRSIACSSTDGKIAASFGKKILIYEAHPVKSSPEMKFPFQWKKVAVLSRKSDVTKLCWDRDGKRLLAGCNDLTIWQRESHEADEEPLWSCTWERKLANPVKFLEFSPDGHFFASAGNADCVIKIWYRAPKVSLKSQNSSDYSEDYNFIYIQHPEAVQSFSWRETSKHMPMCMVPNVLMTSCADDVCRVWTETVKYKPSHHQGIEKNKSDVEVDTKKPRSESDIKQQTANNVAASERVRVQQHYHLVSMYHFHLAAIINPRTDIALLSAIPTQSIFGRSFQLKWLNNKEVELTTAIEAFFASLKEESSEMSNNTSSTDPFLMVDEIDDEIDFQEDADSGEVKTLDQTLEEDELDVIDGVEMQSSSLSLKPPVVEEVPSLEHTTHNEVFSTYHEELQALIHRWCSSSDTIYCIHPVDGSLLIWVIDFLDDFTSAYYRQVQVSFASRIPATFSKADASSLCWSHTFHYTQAQLAAGRQSSSKEANTSRVNSSAKDGDQLTVLQSSYMISAHADGSLNLWLVAFSEGGSFTGIASITHMTRSCGPRFETTQLVCHPVLPLVVGTSLRTKLIDLDTDLSRGSTSEYTDIESELILWHTGHVSPLSEFRGVTEMARISSSNPKKFLKISWIPTLYHHSLLSMTNDGVDLLPNAPCACFVAASSEGLHVYEILLDAKSLLSNLVMLKVSTSLPHHMEILSDLIESEQSGSQSACIMRVCELENSASMPELQFLHVFSQKTLQTDDMTSSLTNETKDVITHACTQTDFVVVAVFDEFGQQKACIWTLEVSFDSKFDLQQSSSPMSPPSVVGDFSPLTPTSPMTPNSPPFFKRPVLPLVISHSLKQNLVYENDLCSDSLTIKQFSAAADVHSSINLNLSLPVKFHIVGQSGESIHFWTIKCQENHGFELVQCDDELPTDLEWTEEIIDIENADHCRFAYITRRKNNTDNTCNYSLHIKESESSGEEYWSDEYSTVICKNCENRQNGSLVELSWLSLENGLYMLATAINNTVYIFCKNRMPVLGSAKGTKHIFKWDLLKQVEIGNELNDYFRLTTISWSGGGFFMIGVENEIQVYSQWEDNKHVKFKRQNVLTSLLNENAEQGVILTTNSFTMACENMKCLPQYHPDNLMQLLNLGKLRRVRAILRNLVRCVAGFEVADAAAATGDMEAPMKSRARTLTKTYSNLSEYSVSPSELPLAEVKENKQNSDLDVIPPLMLTKLMEADKDQSGTVENDGFYENEHNDLSRSAVFYGLAQATLLSEHLSRKHLPGLSSQEQMYLLALSDTVASSKDFDLEGVEMSNSRKYRTKETDSSYSTGGGGGGGYATTGATGVGDFGSDSVDECGLKYLILLRHHTALLKSLSPKQKSALEEKGMLSSEYCWAFHSDCDEELVAMLPGMSRNETTWSELRAHGVGWWIRSNDVLKRTIEKVSKTHFQKNKDPLDCAIFYLAMKKKTLLCALYRSLRDTKMSTFFSNDFSQERWRKAALKNAYALLGKQRFEHAAAFFLLGNSLWDAVQVCVSRLNDIQLALVIARLFENNLEESHRKILTTYVLGYEDEEPCTDPFKRSMGHWLLKEYNESVDVLLAPFQEGNLTDTQYDYPSLFNFYNYLHTHPLIRRRHFTQHRSTSSVSSATSGSKPKLNTQCSTASLGGTSARDLRKYERSLYFHTACIHMNSGLPDIALEVLSMLPSDSGNNDRDKANEENQTIVSDSNPTKTEDMIVTGTFSTETNESNGSYGFGWGSEDFSMSTNRFADLDDGYKIGISLSDDDDTDEEDGGISMKSDKKVDVNGHVEKKPDENTNDENKDAPTDYPALSLKYRCIIQLLIEGLKALPVKCTHEKLKLRSTLKGMLQEELDFLHRLCDHNEKTEEVAADTTDFVKNDLEIPRTSEKVYRSLSSISTDSNSQPPEETSIVEKVEQISIQSKWLKRNQKILSGLYEHCLMIGTGDPELPAVCLELLLLLHEIEDHRVLNAPLTSISVGPSAPPLLLASMTSFSLVASPIAFLQSMAHDLLQTVIDLPALPNPNNPVKRLADLESLMCSLSSCIYHSLCGGADDRLLASIKKGETELAGKQMKDGKLCRIPHGATDIDIGVTSPPTQWPGVKFFLSILSVNKKDDRNVLNLLLCEAAVAVYLSIFVSACSRLSCNNFYRYVLNGLTEDMWNNVFGGGTKIVIPAPNSQPKKNSSPLGQPKDASRSKYVYKMLGNKVQENSGPDPGAQVSYNDNQKMFRHELFIPPNLSLCDYFLKKPRENSSFVYDSDNEESDDEDDDDDGQFDDEIEDDGLMDEEILKMKNEEILKKKAKLTEHFDPTSYPWLIMQLALVEITIKNINKFIVLAGLEPSDLPTQSPLLYNATKILLRWVQFLRVTLDSFPEQEESLIKYYPPYDSDGFARGGVRLQKTKVLLDPDNTPFSNQGKRVSPAKRLWHTLVQQEHTRLLFLHYAFKSANSSGEDATDYEVISGHLLHKDLEPVTSMCINKSNINYMVVSTNTEIIEYDVSGAIEADILADSGANDTDLVFDMMREKKQSKVKSSTPLIIQRRPCTGVRRMDSHPNLPYYVTGGTDGSVRMFEFIHPDQITLFRAGGQFDRVNKISFNPMGNKFAAVDGSGYISVWLVANTQDTTPVCSLKCSKQCLDFAFLGSSSLIATVGSTSEKKNVCMWDTLLPQKKALVHSFVHGSQGAQSIAYVPGQHSIITGGKRGDICCKGIFDLRQRRLLHTFHAHDSLIKTIRLDPAEMFFVTGAVDGDIKVWRLSVHELLDAFPKEHARGTVSLRQVSPGVQCILVMPGCKLFSGGGDGTVKWRQIRKKQVKKR